MDGADASQGRVEVCINSAWGSICNQLFDNDDAGVVCHLLEGFYREGLLCNVQQLVRYNPTLISGIQIGICSHASMKKPTGAHSIETTHFIPGSGPIFLSQLDCTDADTSLLQCNKLSPLGQHTCDHSQDAGVTCVGKLPYIYV